MNKDKKVLEQFTALGKVLDELYEECSKVEDTTRFIDRAYELKDSMGKMYEAIVNTNKGNTEINSEFVVINEKAKRLITEMESRAKKE